MRLRKESDVLVVGAGPVGMFTSLCLAEQGLSVQVIDKEWRGSIHSYALALHPGTLQLLDRHGISESLLREGYKVERMAFFDGEREQAAVEFGRLDGPYPFVLVVPQAALENAIEKRLHELKAAVFWNHQALAVDSRATAVGMRIARMEKFSMGYPVAHTEWMVTKETDTQNSFVIGADGYHSFVRKQSGIGFEQHGDAQAFAVYEFPTHIESAHEARVVFDERGTHVMWPLGDGRVRWSFQIAQDAPPAPNVESLRELLRAHAPWFRGPAEEVYWAATALFERRLAERFGDGRIWLAGDAAHITGPVGAHSMNIGLREAADLAGRLEKIVRQGDGLELLARYGVERRAEWRQLLGIESGVELSAEATDWSRRSAASMLPCVPASGDHLRALLAQTGLTLPLAGA